MKGENKIPFSPNSLRGFTPYKYKSRFHDLSAKNMSQIIIKNSIGYLITDNNSLKGKLLIDFIRSKNIPSQKRLTKPCFVSHPVINKTKKTTSMEVVLTY